MKVPLMIKWRYWNNSAAKAGRASNYLNYIGTRDGVEKLTEEKTYLDYIGTRPRVEKFGANGLFSDESARSLSRYPVKMRKPPDSTAQNGGDPSCGYRKWSWQSSSGSRRSI